MCCFFTALALMEQHSEDRRTGLEPDPGSVSCAPVVTRHPEDPADPAAGPAVGGIALANRIARWLRDEEAVCQRIANNSCGYMGTTVDTKVP